MSNKSLRVEVTQQHINSGRTNHPYECPTALALKEALGVEYVCVIDPREFQGQKDPGYIEWGERFNEPRGRQELTSELEEFITRFDRDEAVEPFSFELVIEEKASD